MRSIAGLAAGETLKAVCEDPQMPSTVLVHSWARKDAAFAAAIAEARALAKARAGVVVDPAKLAEIWRRLGEGEQLHKILQSSPHLPSRAVFKLWRQQDHLFDGELRAYWRRSREGKPRKPSRAFDRQIADRILVRCGRGDRLRDILRSDKAFPCLKVLERWRRETPGFDHELRVCMRFGKAARTRAKVEDLTPEIVEAMMQGASLRSLAQAWAAAGRSDRPKLKTLYSWVATRPEFASDLQLACQIREEDFMEREYEIAMAATPSNLRATKAALRELNGRRGRLKRGLGRRWLPDEGVEE
ncbi:hypothetical protein [Phenylobacterium sp.]|jgi:hypothetical protein|uniref:terminase small subunit-like protein n=1 Tax=Phenylobacterium sp. TaxID=1871053 RepID=UPI002F9277AE